jgi:hypothetical protein
MTVSPEILAAQAAYKARPFMARNNSGTFSGSFRFDTFEGARKYLADQLARQGVSKSGAWAREGLYVHECFVEMPDGSKLFMDDLGLIEIPQGPGSPHAIIVENA